MSSSPQLTSVSLRLGKNKSQFHGTDPESPQNSSTLAAAASEMPTCAGWFSPLSLVTGLILPDFLLSMALCVVQEQFWYEFFHIPQMQCDHITFLGFMKFRFFSQDGQFHVVMNLSCFVGCSELPMTVASKPRKEQVVPKGNRMIEGRQIWQAPLTHLFLL